jgi:hypothetical protein
MDTPSLSSNFSDSNSQPCVFVHYSDSHHSSTEGLAERRFLNFPNTAIERIESSEVDPSFIQNLQEVYGLESKCECCQDLLKRYIQLVKTLDSLVKKESDTLEKEGYKLSPNAALLNEPWLESLEAKNPYSLATNIDSTLKTVDVNIAGSTSGKVVGGFGSVLSYAGFAGDLPVLLKKSVIYFRMYIALKRYSTELKLPGCFRHFLYAKGDRGGIIYDKVTSSARKQAFKSRNDLTKAYSACIAKHLYWRASILKFLGSTVAVAGLLFIFASYIVSYIDPSIQIAIYGYYLEAAAILFYFLMSIGVSAHSKYIDYRVSKANNNMNRALYALECKNTEENPIDLEAIHDSSNEHEAEINIEKNVLKTAYQEAVFQRLRWDVNFSFGHLLANLIQEQNQKRHYEDGQDSAVAPCHITDPEGPVYNLLQGVMGLQNHMIGHLMDVTNKNPLEGIKQLKDLIYKTKIQRH